MKQSPHKGFTHNIFRPYKYLLHNNKKTQMKILKMENFAAVETLEEDIKKLEDLKPVHSFTDLEKLFAENPEKFNTELKNTLKFYTLFYCTKNNIDFSKIPSEKIENIHQNILSIFPHKDLLTKLFLIIKIHLNA